MPGFDGSGPNGMGPMTGGGWGYCGTYNRPYAPRGGFGRRGGFRGRFGQGSGWGRGYGRGPGWGPYDPGWGGWYGPASGGPYNMQPKDEVEMLRGEAGAIQSELDAINRRIQELESQASEP